MTMNEVDSASGKQWHIERAKQLAAKPVYISPECPAAKAKRLANIEAESAAKALRIAAAIDQMLERHTRK